MRARWHWSRLLLIALVATTAARAQSVLVAPNVIVIDGRSRTTAITHVNNGNGPVEVALSTAFGYPVSDSVGDVRLQTFAHVDDSLPSAAGFIQAYPSELVMAPGTRRVIRLLASPPADLKDGEYWARLVVTTHAAKVRGAEDASGGAGAATIGIDLEIRSLLPLFFRQGALETRLSIEPLETRVNGDSLLVRIRMSRQGNAAFVGSVRATLRDGVGSIRDSRVMPMGVYYALSPRLALNCRGLQPGLYQLEIEAVTSRPDVTRGYLLQGPAAMAHASIQLMARVP